MSSSIVNVVVLFVDVREFPLQKQVPNTLSTASSRRHIKAQFVWLTYTAPINFSARDHSYICWDSDTVWKLDWCIADIQTPLQRLGSSCRPQLGILLSADILFILISFTARPVETGSRSISLKTALGRLSDFDVVSSWTLVLNIMSFKCTPVFRRILSTTILKRSQDKGSPCVKPLTYWKTAL